MKVLLFLICISFAYCNEFIIESSIAFEVKELEVFEEKGCGVLKGMLRGYIEDSRLNSRMRVNNPTIDFEMCGVSVSCENQIIKLTYVDVDSENGKEILSQLRKDYLDLLQNFHWKTPAGIDSKHKSWGVLEKSFRLLGEPEILGGTEAFLKILDQRIDEFPNVFDRYALITLFGRRVDGSHGFSNLIEGSSSEDLFLHLSQHLKKGEPNLFFEFCKMYSIPENSADEIIAEVFKKFLDILVVNEISLVKIGYKSNDEGFSKKMVNYVYSETANFINNVVSQSDEFGGRKQKFVEFEYLYFENEKNS